MGVKALLLRFLDRVLGRAGVGDGGLTPQEEAIYNKGERLIPGITHDSREVTRHTSSYEFFRKVIETDLALDDGLRIHGRVEIVDLGCGVGHGCLTLSGIPGSRITGVDVSPECIAYAKHRYGADNVAYRVCDLRAYVPEMPMFDYVVSRGALEHLPNGLLLANGTRWRNRILFDVPYNEPGEANPHHALTGITEDAFSIFPDAEFFYQDLDGIIYDALRKPAKPNMILCVCSRPDLPRVVAQGIPFPLPAWQSGPVTAENR
ncbi:MAG: class I SAM-dependent methyltransferase [Deltaproteobacteria bacterium]|nr:class I SAM-dependent methyltransferase [Deltaproteobacteria bacterium]